MTKSNFLQAASNPQAAQEEIDAQIEQLESVLAQNDAVATLDWVADFALTTSRLAEAEGIDFHFEQVVSMLEDGGYGESVEDGTYEGNVKSMISNTVGRMKEGLVPTGFERILADKMKAEAPTDENTIGLG